MDSKELKERTKRFALRCIKLSYALPDTPLGRHKTAAKNRPSSIVNRQSKGFVLVEMLLVVAVVGLMAGAAMLSFGGIWGNLRFKRQAENLVRVFQLAQNASAETDRHYAVVLDFTEQAYILRQFNSLDLSTMPDDEAILDKVYFNDALTIDYVLYDDLEDTREKGDNGDSVTEARFLAGKSGWQFGGKVVLLDEKGRPWTILVHRFAKPVELVEGDADMYLPQYPEQVPF
ncbi:MAG: prepilin-type N-terminal cleavage/methylation domain-containing protein [Planctomycetaceae bacterium]|nr:prepilin-type N-terminal cleavage/methylation domain-containing protein [Planctomycetaceae bacterium]